MTLSIIDLSIKTYPLFKESILESELMFPKLIRTVPSEIERILTSENPVAKIALLNSDYIGNVLAFCPTTEDIKELEMPEIISDPSLLYLSNYVIDSKYQNKGYGEQMLREAIQTAKQIGYKIIEGHFRKNGSLHNIKKFGAIEIKKYPDWGGAGEDYVHCRLKLT